MIHVGRKGVYNYYDYIYILSVALTVEVVGVVINCVCLLVFLNRSLSKKCYKLSINLHC